MELALDHRRGAPWDTPLCSNRERKGTRRGGVVDDGIVGQVLDGDLLAAPGRATALLLHEPGAPRQVLQPRLVLRVVLRRRRL